MSGSNRVASTKTGLIKGGIFAAAICVLIIGWGLLRSADYEREANNHRAEYAEYTSEKVAEACIGISNLERIKCVDQAFEAKRDYEANQYDLEAQRKSALWAYIMGAAAVIGMALSAVGVWLVKGTFEETKRTNNIARDTARRQLRPYLSVQSVWLDASKTGPKGDRIGYFKVRNSGQTSAIGVCVTTTLSIGGYSREPEPHEFVIVDPGESHIGTFSIVPYPISRWRNRVTKDAQIKVVIVYSSHDGDSWERERSFSLTAGYTVQLSGGSKSRADFSGMQGGSERERDSTANDDSRHYGQ